MAAALARRSRRTVAAVISAALMLSFLSQPGAWAGAVRVTTSGDAVALPNSGTAGLTTRASGAAALAPSLASPGLVSHLSALTPTPTLAPVQQPTMMSPVAIAPAVPLLAPSLRAAPAGQQQKASVGQMSDDVAAQIEVMQKPDVAAEASSSVGGRIEDIITGRRSANVPNGVWTGVLAAPAEAGPSSDLKPADAASASQRTAVKPAAPTQAPVKPTDSRFGYGLKRRILAAAASLFGVTASLPPAGANLAASLKDEAGRKRVLFTDFDDTLGPYNSVLTPEMVAAISAVRQAGKQVAVITDRTDTPGGHQLSAFESLAAIPAAERAGMYVAAVSGGKVYRYNEQGEPVKVWEYPAFDEAHRQPVLEAIAATKAQLGALGTSQHPGDPKNPAESWQPYSYSMMLAVGTPDAAVKKAGRIFERELRQRGLDVKVSARVPKDPANPAYIQFAIVDKSLAVKYISQALGVEPWEALALGDNMYAPQSPETPGRLTRWAQGWAERISGRPLPFTGNETDRNMEKALPGMMALSVGGTADPRMANAYVMPGKGAAVSIEVLRSMASRPADTADPMRYWKMAGSAVALALLVAMIFTSWYYFWQTFYEVASKMVVPGPDIGDLF